VRGPKEDDVPVYAKITKMKDKLEMAGPDREALRANSFVLSKLCIWVEEVFKLRVKALEFAQKKFETQKEEKAKQNDKKEAHDKEQDDKKEEEGFEATPFPDEILPDPVMEKFNDVE